MYEFVEFLEAVGVGKTQHRPLVVHLFKGLGEAPTHSLGRTVGVSYLWVRLLQFLKLAEQSIKFRVAYLGMVGDVVATVVLVQFLAQLENSIDRGHAFKGRA